MSARVGFGAMIVPVIVAAAMLTADTLGGWTKPLSSSPVEVNVGLIMAAAGFAAFFAGYGFATAGDPREGLDGGRSREASAGGGSAVAGLTLDERQVLRLVEGAEPIGLPVPSWFDPDVRSAIEARFGAALSQRRSAAVRSVELARTLESLRERGLVCGGGQQGWRRGGHARLTERAKALLARPLDRAMMTATGTPAWWDPE